MVKILNFTDVNETMKTLKCVMRCYVYNWYIQ